MLAWWSFVLSMPQRQQAGRAGRRARDALGILVADALPVDQYYVEQPDELFDRSTNELMIDLDNKVILEAHLQCAAHEMPLTAEDEKYFGATMLEICETKLSRDKEGWSVSDALNRCYYVPIFLSMFAYPTIGTTRTHGTCRILRSMSPFVESRTRSIA